MQKYRWTLFKTLEFLNSRRPDLEIRASFISQLSDFERKLELQNRGPKTGDWNELYKQNIPTSLMESEELVLRNTFLNAQMGPVAFYSPNDMEERDRLAVQWVDNGSNNKEQLRTNES